jgi:hypothetical protein
VPRRPDFSHHERDVRLDRYRDRVGRLFRDDTEVGLVLVTVEPFAICTSGHLWWQRWGPTYDVLWPWTVIDGKRSDSLLPQDATDEELADYDQGRFRYYGEALRVEWLDREESASLRASEFGM